MCIFAICFKRRQETVSMPRYRLKQQLWTIIFGLFGSQLQMRRHLLAY